MFVVTCTCIYFSLGSFFHERDTSNYLLIRIVTHDTQKKLYERKKQKKN